MARSLAALAAGLAVYTTVVAAASQSYQLVDSYTPGNFWDKFNFITDADPNGGFVRYVDRGSAQAAGLIKTGGDTVTLGVDTTSVLDSSAVGRNSVRVESAQTYKYGLFVGTFTHFPQPVCGSWPAFWMFSEGTRGEFDIYEMWNQVASNQITYHTSEAFSSCAMGGSVDGYNPLIASNCYSDMNIGCGVQEIDGQWGSPSGGVYALLWSDTEVSVWSWPLGTEPSDLATGTPDPSNWPTPHAQLTSSTCDIASAFGNMNIRLNIDFCSTSGVNGIWDACAASTGSTCVDYISLNPAALQNVYFEIAGIDVYQLRDVPTISTSAPPPPPPPSASPSSEQPEPTRSFSFSGNYSRPCTTPLPETSTVYATTVYTITSCAATVTDCPGRLGQVTTEVVSVSTTVVRPSNTGTGAAVVSTRPSPTFVTVNSGVRTSASIALMALGAIVFVL